MPVRTKRWNDAVEPEDGARVLVCRYRPRGVKKEDEPWEAWCPALAPSPALHARAYGKNDEPAIPFAEYERAFLEEMKPRGYWINGYADAVRAGKTITLLCSSACVDESRCHRSILKTLIERAAFPPPAPKHETVVRRRKT
jgi:uncharacterized protein YeaO (DUF488 family)